MIDSKDVILYDAELNNGLEVCVWRNVDNATFEISVIDPRDIWDSSRDEVVKTEKEVVNVLAKLNQEVL